MNNPPPTGSSVDISADLKKPIALRMSALWIQWFSYLERLLNFVLDYSQVTPTIPVNGFSITIGNGVQVLQLDPAGVLATGTVTMPSTPYAGQVVEIDSTRTITSITVSPNAGQTIMNAPTTLTGGSGVAWYWNANTTTWYRRY